MFNHQEILDFWFEGLSSEKAISSKIPIVKKWFSADSDFDTIIRKKFFHLFEDSVVEVLVEEDHTSRERLAKIILFDQFTRNIFRNTPKMYAFDSLALKLALEGLERKEDWSLKLYERLFFYMPLMHAENLKLQEQSVVCFESLFEDAKIAAKHSSSYFSSNLQYARQHYEIIKRFGRFPHRNQILQRESTPEEVVFLKK